MRFILRLICGIVAFGLILFPFLLLSWWLTVFALLGLGYVLWGKHVQRPWAPLLFGFLTIILLIVLQKKDVLPSHSRTTSCESSLESKVFGRGSSSGTTGLNAPKELEVDRLTFQRDVSRLLYRAKRAIDVDVMLNSIGRILELQSAPGLEAPRKEVNDGTAGIRQFMNEKNLTKKDSRKDLYKTLETEVNPLLETAKQATDRKKFREELGPKLFEIENGSLLASLGEKMFSLQESLLALTRQSVDAKPVYFISWKDADGHAIYREEIAVTSRQDASLVEIDASLLKREAENSNIRYNLAIKNGDGSPQPVQDTEHIPIEPRTKQVTIVFDRMASPEIVPYCKSAPIATIRRLRFVWPTSADSVRLGATLASGDLRLPTWFSVNRNLAESQNVKEIALPEYSYFASRQELQVTTKDERDVLAASTPNLLSIRSFGADQTDEKANWIEVLQSSKVLRNFLVNKYREYLVVENAIGGILALGLGILIGFLFPKIA